MTADEAVRHLNGKWAGDQALARCPVNGHGKGRGEPAMYRVTIVLFACLSVTGAAHAHSGGLNAQGCHNDRKNGGYQCHRAPSPPPPPARNEQPRGLLSPSTAYSNCAAARAAGAAPLQRGEPGYGEHLDRDNDGIACE